MVLKYLVFSVMIIFLIFPILPCKGQSSGLNIIVENTNLSNSNSTPNEITANITGFLNHDTDGYWRYYLVINVTNNGQNNVTLSNIRTEILNATYVDGSFEVLNLPASLTANKVLGSHSSGLYYLKVTDNGFLNEPKTIWVKQDVFLLGLDNPFTSTFEIPVFTISNTLYIHASDIVSSHFL